MKRDIEKVIDVSIQASQLTSEVLKQALGELMDGKLTRKGKMDFGTLVQKSGGKLEAVEVNDKNIGDFLAVASKYDIDFSVKRSSNSDPPTYHVFFASRSSENFQRAFTEYTSRNAPKAEQKEPYTVSREQINNSAKAIAKTRSEKSHEKVRTRQKENVR